MAYRAKSYRDSLGEPLDRPRDLLTDTATDLVRLVKEARDSGSYPDLGKILDAQARFATQTQLKTTSLEQRVATLAERIEGRFRLIEQQVKLMLWAAGIIFVAIVGALVAAPARVLHT